MYILYIFVVYNVQFLSMVMYFKHNLLLIYCKHLYDLVTVMK